jgi:putative spermidine/putrescine transport system substrate-binding protein
VLRKQHPLIQRYWHDANVQVQDMTNEGVVASGSWPFQVNTLGANKQPIASTVPVEGATGWADTTMLAASAKHPNCAYKWLDGRSVRKCRATSRRGSARCRSCPRRAPVTICSTAEGCKTNGIDNFDKIKFWRTPEAKCASQNDACIRTAAGDRLRRGDGRPVANSIRP